MSVCKLMGKLELNKSEDLTLTQEETRFFETLIRKENNALPFFREWLPWWLSKTTDKLANVDKIHSQILH